MKVIINENQKKLILSESISGKLSTSIKNMEKFTKDIVTECKKTTGIDFSFLLSWGATLGGLFIPVTEFIKGEHPELTSTEISLLITGAMVTYYSSNKEMLGKLLNKIKEKGLVEIFDEVLESTQTLKETFLSFIESLNVTTSKLSNMLAYTFLIPILPKLFELSQMRYDQDIINEIVKRLIGYGIVIVSSVTLTEIVNKIIKRFRS